MCSRIECATNFARQHLNDLLLLALSLSLSLLIYIRSFVEHESLQATHTTFVLDVRCYCSGSSSSSNSEYVCPMHKCTSPKRLLRYYCMVNGGRARLLCITISGCITGPLSTSHACVQCVSAFRYYFHFAYFFSA